MFNGHLKVFAKTTYLGKRYYWFLFRKEVFALMALNASNIVNNIYSQESITAITIIMGKMT